MKVKSTKKAMRALRGSKVTPQQRATAPVTSSRTRLSVPFDRQDRAVVVLFYCGFEMCEIAALLRRSQPMVELTIRKALR